MTIRKHVPRAPTAIIRAAGRGERLGEITRYFQKCVLPVEGRPLIVHWVDATRQRGLARHVIIGYKGNQVMEAVQDYEGKGWLKGELFTTSSMMHHDGIWEDTRHQIEKLRFLQDRLVLLCYADNYSPDLVSIIDEMLNTGRLFLDHNIDAMIGLIPKTSCSSASQRAILGESLVPRFQRGRDAGDDIVRVRSYLVGQEKINGWAWAGIALIQPEVFGQYQDVDTVSVLSSVANEGRLAGVRLRVVDYRDVQTIWGDHGRC